jgi:hypothetical protein
MCVLLGSNLVLSNSMSRTDAWALILNVYTHIYIYILKYVCIYIYICLYPLETIKELTLTQKVKAYTAHGFTPVDSLTDDFSKGYKVQVSPYHPIVWGANFFFVVQLWATVPRNVMCIPGTLRNLGSVTFFASFAIVEDFWSSSCLFDPSNLVKLYADSGAPCTSFQERPRPLFFSASNIEHFGDLRQHHDGQPLQMWWKDMERTSWQLDFLVQCALPQGPPVMLVACNLSHYRYMMIYIYIIKDI